MTTLLVVAKASEKNRDHIIFSNAKIVFFNIKKQNVNKNCTIDNVQNFTLSGKIWHREDPMGLRKWLSGRVLA